MCIFKKPWKDVISLILTQIMIFSFAFIPINKVKASTSLIVNPISQLSPDFIRGMDVSMLKQIEKVGGKFFDNGQEKDCLQILKDHGVNWIRLRVWNDPKDENGIDIGGGNCDLQMAVDISKRAKALGLKVLIDFHYSDFWADPGTQTKPKAWQNLSYEQLKQAMYDFTANAINMLNANNATPDMVQIGNEVNNGFLWPDGQISGTGAGGYDKFADLLKQGIKAVRDNDPNASDPSKKIKIMIHLSNGGSNSLYRSVFDNLTQRNVDFDVIGVSYYPYWHGTINDLKANINDISQRYNKEIVIAETAYAWTLENGDNFENIFKENEESVGGYKATIQGQATAVRDVMEAVSQVPNGKGLGVFYWEGDWIPASGAGWKTGEGNGWDNQAMFDFNGNALPSLDVFNLVYSNNQPVSLEIQETIPVKITTPLGEAPTLPTTVKAIYNDHSIKSVSVTWENYDNNLLEQLGTFSIYGQIQGTSIKAIANITVSGKRNYVKNSSFETGNFQNWDVQVLSGPSSAVLIERSPGNNAYSGDYTLHYWAANSFKFVVSQTITGLKNGTYTLYAYTHGGGGENALQLIASGYGGPDLISSTQHTGWRNFKKVVVSGINVTNGQCTIKILVDGNGGNWGSWDNVVFTEDFSNVTLSASTMVNSNNDFNVVLGVYELDEEALAAEINLSYSSELFDLVDVQGLSPDTLIVDWEKAQSNVQIFIANKNGLNNKQVLTLKFKSKSIINEDKTGSIFITSIKLGAALDGRVFEVVKLSSISIKVIATKEISTTTSQISSTTASSLQEMSQTKAEQSKPISEVKTETKESVVAYKVENRNLIIEQKPNIANNVAVVKLNKDTLYDALSKINNANLTIKVDNIANTKSVQVEIPTDILNKSTIGGKLELVTPIANISIPVKSINIEQGTNLTKVNIAKGDILNIDKNIRNQIINNQIIEVNLLNDDKKISEFNQPITITIGCKVNDESIGEYLSILHISKDGKNQIIPNAKYNKLDESITFKTSHLSQFAIIKSFKTFKDINNLEWAKKSIEILASKGIIEGVNNDNFLPSKTISRAEFVTMLVRAFGFYAKFDENFEDVNNSDYCYEYLGIAKKIGLVKGKDNNRFYPMEPIKREDMAVLISRAIEIEKGTKFKAESSDSLSNFKDISDISEYAVDYIKVLVSQNIITGKNGYIMPKAFATRAEAATMLYRALNNY